MLVSSPEIVWLMPALKVGEAIIAQSSAILEYLEEAYPARPLLPTDPIERAQARAFASLISADTHPLCNYRVRKYLVQEMNASDDAVLAWMRGTGLRPVLSALGDASERATFESAYADRLRGAYPRHDYGTVLPYRRIFVVASRA